MNEILKHILLAGGKFMPDMQLRQHGFTYNSCGLFSKNKKRIRKIKETEYWRYIY